MLSDRKRVCQYLLLIKQYSMNEFVVLPRRKNMAFLYEWGIDFETAREIVLTLGACDYVKGPCTDDKGLPNRSDVWVFGKTLSWNGTRVETYIKLTVSATDTGLGCVCVSFHESEHALNYAFRGEQREDYLLP